MGLAEANSRPISSAASITYAALNPRSPSDFKSRFFNNARYQRRSDKQPLQEAPHQPSEAQNNCVAVKELT